MAWISYVHGLLIASAAILLLQGCGSGGGGGGEDDCKPMTNTDPCFEKCNPELKLTYNCTEKVCEDLGTIGCKNSHCQVMGSGLEAHCMSGGSDDCKPMTSTDPCFEKCNPEMKLTYNCSENLCKDLGAIGCKNSHCQVMGSGSEAHCMSAMSRVGDNEETAWQITKHTECKPENLAGVYHDMHDNNNKIITVSTEYGVTIAPPPPQSKYYVDGVGQDWILQTCDIGIVSFNCHVSDIDFNVKNKPSPPPSNVTADWVFTPLLNIGWVKECNAATIGNAACGQAGKYPLRDSPKPVFALAFGTFAMAGNVWVKIADVPSNVIIN